MKKHRETIAVLFVLLPFALGPYGSGFYLSRLTLISPKMRATSF
jgi:hypothetical protein